MTLSRTRAQAFSGLGSLCLQDIVTLYHAEQWADAEMALPDYIETMLFLDSAAREHYALKNPTKT